jgi:hypothetical protein
MPANACDSSLCSACSEFTQKTWLALIAALVALLPWMQTKTMAGSSLNAQTAEQVTPATPAGPSVVITDTVVASLERALRNSTADTHGASPSGARTCGADCDMVAFPQRICRRALTAPTYQLLPLA